MTVGNSDEKKYAANCLNQVTNVRKLKQM